MSGPGFGYGYTGGAASGGGYTGGGGQQSYQNSYQPVPAAQTYGFTAATAPAYAPSYAPAPPQPPQQSQVFAQPYAPAPKTQQQHAPQPPAPKTNPSTYTGYDAAVYAAATSYLQSKAQGTNSQWLGLKKPSHGTNAASNPTHHIGLQQRSAMAKSSSSSRDGGSFPKKTSSSSHYSSSRSSSSSTTSYRHNPQSLHYCEVCKISCAGPQTYKEHLEGQKHKKKEQAAKTGTSPHPMAKTRASFRCDLCDVTCTGQDTYQAHVRGAKHLKTVKLHQTLGKPIPSSNPQIITPSGAKGFVQGKNLSNTGPDGKSSGGSGGGSHGYGSGSNSQGAGDDNEAALEAALALEKDIKPVGEDYVEPMKDHTGKVVQFYCKLCDCKFNDLNAKNMHLKGRRHRLQFKKKVNPDLEVDLKFWVPGGRPNQRKHEEKLRKDLMRLRQQELWSMRAMYPDPAMTPAPLFARGGGGGGHSAAASAAQENMDDRHVMAKHDAIYPTDDELRAVHDIVGHVETALKGVSDALHKEDMESENGTATEKTTGTEKQTETTETAATEGAEKSAEAKEGEGAAAEEAKDTKERTLKGVMRVGPLAKGLLLRGDLSIKLVVLCSVRPTKTLLRRVMELLPAQLEASGESFDVTLDVDSAALKVTATTEPRPNLTIVLTSVLMRSVEQEEGADDPDILDKAKCLEALADLRHAKWFQARCTNLGSCLVVLRMMRDICQRIPTWGPLSSWALELLVEKVLSSAGGPLSGGAALRRVLEAVASGLLLPSGPGLLDPCEKDSKDALELSGQQREDITSSAQHALRLVAFNQLHKILGIPRISTSRKRPDHSDNANGKKIKTDDDE